MGTIQQEEGPGEEASRPGDPGSGPSRMDRPGMGLPALLRAPAALWTLGTLGILGGWLLPADPAAALVPNPAQGYSVQPVPEELSEAFSSDQLALLEMLNRADVPSLARRDEMVVPEAWGSDPMEHSPLPRDLPALSQHPKALVVHQPLQVFAAYENGRMVRWGPVSTGRAEHPTPAGRYHLNWRSRGRTSTVNPDWYLEWYFNFQNERGLSFHEYALPGEPASHACVRLLEGDARWLYDWGESWTLDDRGWEVQEEGTPVWIVGELSLIHI